MKQRWSSWSTKKQTWAAVGAIFLVLMLIGAAAGGGDSENEQEAQAPTPTTAAVQQQAAKAPEPAPKPPSAEDKLRKSLEDNDVKARIETITPQEISIKATTPDGGFEGPSVDDLNRAAGEIFHSVYGDAGFTRETFIGFSGGLVSKATGKPDNEALTGTFRMTKAEAEQVAWDEQAQVSAIDWDVYRGFAHPALKQD
jgi:hypothetical protein